MVNIKTAQTKWRNKKTVLIAAIVVFILVQTSICRATIMSGHWDWQDEPILRQPGIWFEVYGGMGSPGPIMSAYGPWIGENDFLWSMTDMVIEDADITFKNRRLIEYTTVRTGGTFELAEYADLWGDGIILDDVTATVTELINFRTGRLVRGEINLVGFLDGIEVQFQADLLSFFRWFGFHAGVVRRVSVDIIPEPSSIIIFGMLTLMCLPFRKYIQ